MKERASRLQSAYGELLKRKLAVTKKDIAKKMGASAPNVSSAFKGDQRVLTDRFLSRFNAAFDNIFDLNWLLTGKGEMLAHSIHQEINGDNNTQVAGNDNQSIDKTINRLLDELASQRRLVERAMTQTDRVISLLEKRSPYQTQ